MHCVDLGESFPTSIYLWKSASIQPRTSPSEFGGKFNSILIRLLRCDTDMGSAGNRSPPVKPEVSVGGMLGVLDAMGEHSKANFVDYTGQPLGW